ncbi:transcriptional regulator [Burkholderia cenocepacia]|uniref:transcriptional regulator n=1 Tax=Burkholderia cenocepacia TaxID=95486 RepID=UPI002ABD77B5|nr:transcriptional regulator [Burkholderia cenocepacia]
MTQTTIRAACLRPFSDTWTEPTPDEVREILHQARLTGVQAGHLVGVKDRQVRRWLAGDAVIPYGAWAILCDAAGHERIWIERQE